MAMPTPHEPSCTVAAAQLLGKRRLPGETFAARVPTRRNGEQAVACTAQAHSLSHPVLVLHGVHRHAFGELRREADFPWSARGSSRLKLQLEVVPWHRQTNGHTGSRLTKAFPLGRTPRSTRETVDELVSFQVEADEALELLHLAVKVIWLCFLGEFGKKSKVSGMNHLCTRLPTS